MGVSDDKNWKTEKQQSLHIGDSTFRSGCMGKTKDASERHGNDSLIIGGEDSQRGHFSVGGSRASQKITGKSINALIDETETQLNYHKEQVEILESRLANIRHTAQLLEEDNKE